MAQQPTNRPLEAIQELIKVFDELLGVGQWQENLFLRGVEKKIQDMRAETAQLAEQLAQEAIAATPAAILKAQAGAEANTIYISIYQHTPNDLTKWEKTLRGITEYSVTRPIYTSEEHVQEMIRSRPDPNKEAYVAVSVKAGDIIKGLVGKATTDKAGHDLLAIRDGGVQARNIKKFVHSGKTYEFIDGMLKLMTNA